MDPTSTRVVDRVSDALGLDPLDLPPLYDAVDPDALDELTGDGGGRYRLSFPFAGVRIHVSETGDVRIVESEAE
ncbi:hypothetical protein DU500_08310 [Haloplanus rubicundus]|uniref:Halobacterial output domain-containing protein n=1 Tax=Haloplanus rubicundus TaxID=1547898 RepID=A0A345E2K0_9EURY|nr:HalOD1 output domain-containing protein [Haloplanus rubicundus]AXG06422.1 hypothetical protein DU500_08310 [Haloplanus rubicundus]AXG09841.1 hypothetical protein DU484_08270 [Haloplanus rubicundus]